MKKIITEEATFCDICGNRLFEDDVFGLWMIDENGNIFEGEVCEDCTCNTRLCKICDNAAKEENLIDIENGPVCVSCAKEIAEKLKGME